MKNFVLLLGLVVAGLVVLSLFAATLKANAGTNNSQKRDLRAKPLLTEREQSMFFRLVKTFPDHVVLSQVSFSALLTSRQQATRNGFNRKFADFVLCTKAFTTLAVIELDDNSHNGKEEADFNRDEWLTSAGYRVLRYANIPDTDRLLMDFAPAQRQNKVPHQAQAERPQKANAKD